MPNKDGTGPRRGRRGMKKHCREHGTGASRQKESGRSSAMSGIGAALARFAAKPRRKKAGGGSD